jgi:hypothetical protein
LHHILAELGMSHEHGEELDELPSVNGHAGEDDKHGAQLASALEEVGPCFIKLLHQASRMALGVVAGSILIGGGQVLSALIRTGAIGRRNGR